jgi:hypothetical protein
MTKVMNYYAVSDFSQLLKTRGVNPLDKFTVDVISYLEKNIVIPPPEPESTMKKMDRPPNDNRSKRGRRNGDSHRGGMSPAEEKEDWNKIRQFKNTKVENKEGIEKSFTDIRVLMNKLSSKNYDSQKDTIFSALDELCGEGSTVSEENQDRVLSIILDIVCGNKFYSELYADLYKELVDRFEIFRDSLDQIVDRYLGTLEKIHYVDHNVDYDGFCNYTKTNDLRKANASFIVHLMKKDVLPKTKVTSILSNLIDLLKLYIDEENRTNEFDEITENLFLIITQSKGFIEKEPIWTSTIFPSVQYFSKQNAKEHKSLSSRAVFKYMDIMESM